MPCVWGVQLPKAELHCMRSGLGCSIKLCVKNFGSDVQQLATWPHWGWQQCLPVV